MVQNVRRPFHALGQLMISGYKTDCTSLKSFDPFCDILWSALCSELRELIKQWKALIIVNLKYWIEQLQFYSFPPANYLTVFCPSCIGREDCLQNRWKETATEGLMKYSDTEIRKWSFTCLYLLASERNDDKKMGKEKRKWNENLLKL